MIPSQAPTLQPSGWAHKNQWMPQPRPPVRLSAPQNRTRECDRYRQSLAFNPELLHLPCEYAGHPALTSLLGRWLRNLQPKPCQTRSFRERWAVRQESPECLRSLAMQVSQVLDIEPLTVSVSAREATIYAEVGQVDAKLHLLCHPDLEKLTRSEQRFLVMRAVYAHFQKHNAMLALAQNWNQENREHLLSLFFGWNQRNSKPILNEDWAHLKNSGDLKSVARLSQWLNRLFVKYQSNALGDLRELLVRSHPFRRELELEADLFATQACGLDTAAKLLPLLYGADMARQQQGRLAERLDSLQSPLF